MINSLVIVRIKSVAAVATIGNHRTWSLFLNPRFEAEQGLNYSIIMENIHLGG